MPKLVQPIRERDEMAASPLSEWIEAKMERGGKSHQKTKACGKFFTDFMPFDLSFCLQSKAVMFLC